MIKNPGMIQRILHDYGTILELWGIAVSMIPLYPDS